jgi:hypothetical protein
MKINHTHTEHTQAFVALGEKGSRPGAGTPVDGHLDQSAMQQLESATRLPKNGAVGKQTPQMHKFWDTLTNCPPPGSGVHGWIMSAANYAAAAGEDPARAVVSITNAMTRTPAPTSEVVEAVKKAYVECGAKVGRLHYPIKPKPAPLSAAEFIKCGAEATEADLIAASPVKIDRGDTRRLAACALLKALFCGCELVYCGDQYGRTVRPRDEWIGRFLAGEPIPPLLCVNPLKAEGGVTAGGQPSPRCDDAVAVFRHAVVEFDAMPLSDQFRFWKGFGLETVTAITFSAGKSLHALLRVDAVDRAEWNRAVKDGLFRRRLIPLGCDRACVNPARLTRLAGACRPDKGGAVQKLLFVREELT